MRLLASSLKIKVRYQLISPKFISHGEQPPKCLSPARASDPSCWSPVQRWVTHGHLQNGWLPFAYAIRMKSWCGYCLVFLCCSWINFHCNFTLSSIQSVSNRMENYCKSRGKQCTHQMQHNACVILAVHRKNDGQPRGCISSDSLSIVKSSRALGYRSDSKKWTLAVSTSAFNTTYVIPHIMWMYNCINVHHLSCIKI